MTEYVLPICCKRFAIPSGPLLHDSVVDNRTKLTCEGVGPGAEKFESIIGGYNVFWMVTIDLRVGSNLMEFCLFVWRS